MRLNQQEGKDAKPARKMHSIESLTGHYQEDGSYGDTRDWVLPQVQDIKEYNEYAALKRMFIRGLGEG